MHGWSGSLINVPYGAYLDHCYAWNLQTHFLRVFVANLKNDAIYGFNPESFCDKNLAIRKVFAFSDSELAIYVRNCHDTVTLAKNPLCLLCSLRHIAYMHYTFKLGISQLGVWFLCRWYWVFSSLVVFCWRRLCDFKLGLVWISFLVWPTLAFQIIWYDPI